MRAYSINRCGFVFAIILTLSKSTYSQFLRPIQSEMKNNPRETISQKDLISLFETKDFPGIIKVDLNKPLIQQTILIRNSRSMKINLYCSISKPTSLKTEDVTMQLCYQASVLRKVVCSDLSVIQCKTGMFGMTMSVKKNQNESGYDIFLDSVSNENIDLSGYYYCKSSSLSSGLVLSNVLEIRDIIYWETNLIPSPRQPVLEMYNKSLDTNHMPKTFTCMDQVKSFILRNIPSWIELEFESIAKWAWCPVTKQRNNLVELEKTYTEECLNLIVSKCQKRHYLCPYKNHRMPGWKEFTSFDGTITLLSGQKFPDYGNKLDGYALMCYYKTRDNYKALRYIAHDYGGVEILKGLQWSNGINDRSSIEIISPMKQTIRVGILKSGFTLTAFYYSPSHVTYEWRRDGNTLFNSSDWSVTQYTLQYKRTVTLEYQGDYHLQVKYGHQEIEFIFDVAVCSPPLQVNTSITALSSSIFAMVGSNISIVYQYEAKPTNILLYINGLVYLPKVSDHTIFMNDLTRIFPNLKDLKFDVTRKNTLNNLDSLFYTVTNASFSDASIFPQDHSIIVEARNAYGISRSHLNVILLKFPTFKNVPMYDNCTAPCEVFKPHLFRCEINNKYYIDREVQVEKFWMVNNMRLDLQQFYSTFFTEDSKGLYLNTLHSNKSDYNSALRLLFKNTDLICRIRLLYPGSLGLSEQSLHRENRVIFDTMNDPKFMRRLTTKITLDLEHVTSNATYTWVVFVMIVLILIVMFVFLLVRLSLRDQVKSYQMGQERVTSSENTVPRRAIAGISSICHLCTAQHVPDHNNTKCHSPTSINDLSFKQKLIMCLSQNRPRLASINLVERMDNKVISRDEEMVENETLESYIRPNSPENGMNLSSNRSIFIGYTPQEPMDNENDFEDANSMKMVHS